MINPVNPYHAKYGDSDGLAAAPFAGRKEAFARLYARLYDPVNTGALCFWGAQHSGKSAMLRNADTVFKETAVGVYVPLRDATPESEANWLLALAQAITAALTEHGFTLSRLSQLDPLGDQPREWLETTFLPQTLGAVRRKLLILIDDADRLLMAERAGTASRGHLRLSAQPDAEIPRFAYRAGAGQRFRAGHRRFRAAGRATDVIRLGNLLAGREPMAAASPVARAVRHP